MKHFHYKNDQFTVGVIAAEGKSVDSVKVKVVDEVKEEETLPFASITAPTHTSFFEVHLSALRGPLHEKGYRWYTQCGRPISQSVYTQNISIPPHIKTIEDADEYQRQGGIMDNYVWGILRPSIDAHLIRNELKALRDEVAAVGTHLITL